MGGGGGRAFVKNQWIGSKVGGSPDNNSLPSSFLNFLLYSRYIFDQVFSRSGNWDKITQRCNFCRSCVTDLHSKWTNANVRSRHESRSVPNLYPLSFMQS